jgi:hypothetical protein
MQLVPSKKLTVTDTEFSRDGSLDKASLATAAAAPLLNGSFVDTPIRAASRTAFWVRCAV